MRGAPVPPEEYTETGEQVLTDEVLAAQGWAYGLGAWEQIGKAYEWYLNEGRGDHPSGLDNAQMWSLQEAIKAHARRGDPVAEWIKRFRDQYRYPSDPRWDVLDTLLDDYRAHADTGTPLSEDVQGPHGEGS
jgi:hypothetical protein